MIEKNVVFVLGAGASCSYGYPMGRQLIREMLQPENDVKAVLQQAGFNLKQLSEFQAALKAAKPSSIDSFLEYRTEFLELGKAMIAAAIIRCEQLDRLLQPDPDDDDWYQKLIDRLNAPLAHLLFSNVTIATFNYDRSLEECLYQAFCNRHKANCEQIAGCLNSMKIIHLYGSVGQLDWQAKGGRKYSNELSSLAVRNAAQSIQIISEHPEESPTFQEARDRIRKADYVFCLGMAYHEENMRRLGFKARGTVTEPIKGGHGITARVIGSACGLTEAEREYHRKKWGIDEMGGTSHKCIEFLRNRPEFFEL